MGADNQAESVPERKRLSAIAKIKQDLAWRSVTGVLREHIVLTRQQAEELVAEFERFSTQGGKSDLNRSTSATSSSACWRVSTMCSLRTPVTLRQARSCLIFAIADKRLRSGTLSA